MTDTPLQLGQASALPALARGGAARPGAEPASGHRLRGALHGAGIHLALPGHRPAGFRASGHRLRAGTVAGRIEVAEALSRTASAITARSTRIARSPSASASPTCSSRASCASAAIGIRAAACRSTCSGRPASCRRTSGCPTRASRPIGRAAERRGRRQHGRRRSADAEDDERPRSMRRRRQARYVRRPNPMSDDAERLADEEREGVERHRGGARAAARPRSPGPGRCCGACRSRGP